MPTYPCLQGTGFWTATCCSALWGFAEIALHGIQGIRRQHIKTIQHIGRTTQVKELYSQFCTADLA